MLRWLVAIFLSVIGLAPASAQTDLDWDVETFDEFRALVVTAAQRSTYHLAATSLLNPDTFAADKSAGLTLFVAQEPFGSTQRQHVAFMLAEELELDLVTVQFEYLTPQPAENAGAAPFRSIQWIYGLNCENRLLTMRRATYWSFNWNGGDETWSVPLRDNPVETPPAGTVNSAVLAAYCDQETLFTP